MWTKARFNSSLVGVVVEVLKGMGGKAEDRGDRGTSFAASEAKNSARLRLLKGSFEDGPDSDSRLSLEDRFPDAVEEERARLRIPAEMLVTTDVKDLGFADLPDDEELVLGLSTIRILSSMP